MTDDAGRRPPPTTTRPPRPRSSAPAGRTSGRGRAPRGMLSCLFPLVLALALCCACSDASGAGRGLDTPREKDIALQLVSSAENSSLDWRAQYAFVKDIGDGRGYTAGVIGFCTACGDLLNVVRRYTAAEPGNRLARFLPALGRVKGTDSHEGLGAPFVAAWRASAADPRMRAAQDEERDLNYFGPAVARGKADGLGALGQFVYFDALVMHGPGDDAHSFGGIRARAVAHAKPPAQGGDETRYLTAFLDARVRAMRGERGHHDTSRVDTEQRVFLREGNLSLEPPLQWRVYGDHYRIR